MVQDIIDQQDREIERLRGLLNEIADESAEDWRTRKYVVVQMTESTWDKVLAWRAEAEMRAAAIAPDQPGEAGK